MSFVLDASVALLWALPKSNPQGLVFAEAVLDVLRGRQAVVPAVWSLEVVNVLARAESRGVLSEADSHRFLSLLERLNIVCDPETVEHAMGSTLHLARRYRLSAYDSAYLELALRRGLPVATLDSALSTAVTEAGLPVLAV